MKPLIAILLISLSASALADKPPKIKLPDNSKIRQDKLVRFYVCNTMYIPPDKPFRYCEIIAGKRTCWKLKVCD